MKLGDWLALKKITAGPFVALVQKKAHVYVPEKTVRRAQNGIAIRDPAAAAISKATDGDVRHWELRVPDDLHDEILADYGGPPPEPRAREPKGAESCERRSDAPR